MARLVVEPRQDGVPPQEQRDTEPVNHTDNQNGGEQDLSLQATASHFASIVATAPISADQIIRTWEEIINKDDSNLAQLTVALESVSSQLHGHTVGGILSLSGSKSADHRRRADTVRIFNRWCAWPWELTSFPPTAWSRNLLEEICNLGKTGCGKAQVIELLDTAIESRCQRKAKGIRSTKQLTVGDVIDAIKEFEARLLELDQVAHTDAPLRQRKTKAQKSSRPEEPSPLPDAVDPSIPDPNPPQPPGSQASDSNIQPLVSPPDRRHEDTTTPDPEHTTRREPENTKFPDQENTTLPDPENTVLPDPEGDPTLHQSQGPLCVGFVPAGCSNQPVETELAVLQVHTGNDHDPCPDESNESSEVSIEIGRYADPVEDLTNHGFSISEDDSNYLDDTPRDHLLRYRTQTEISPFGPRVGYSPHYPLKLLSEACWVSGTVDSNVVKYSPILFQDPTLLLSKPQVTWPASAMVGLSQSEPTDVASLYETEKRIATQVALMKQKFLAQLTTFREEVRPVLTELWALQSEATDLRDWNYHHDGLLASKQQIDPYREKLVGMEKRLAATTTDLRKEEASLKKETEDLQKMIESAKVRDDADTTVDSLDEDTIAVEQEYIRTRQALLTKREARRDQLRADATAFGKHVHDLTQVLTWWDAGHARNGEQGPEFEGYDKIEEFHSFVSAWLSDLDSKMAQLGPQRKRKHDP